MKKRAVSGQQNLVQMQKASYSAGKMMDRLLVVKILRWKTSTGWTGGRSSASPSETDRASTVAHVVAQGRRLLGGAIYKHSKVVTKSFVL